MAALRAAGERARGSTLYCTLEPCNHFGRTPPCTDAILEAGVRRVVIGAADPAPHVPGAIVKLVNAGVSVVVGVREPECKALIADFARHITRGLPYVVLKAAVTLDGRIAARTGDSRWITGERARREAHRMRDRADAVLVGVGTVLADDPALTVRHVRGRDPLRVVLDTRLRTPPSAAMLRSGSAAPTVVVHGAAAGAPERRALEQAGAELLEVPLAGERLDLEAALRALAARDVVRVLAEGRREGARRAPRGRARAARGRLPGPAPARGSGGRPAGGRGAARARRRRLAPDRAGATAPRRRPPPRGRARPRGGVSWTLPGPRAK
ncbi:MAG: bifunctional diaminohydroxyphosphoribosylaminopyrimidine deaminase/5-amino-6-(5-phosphoribosylamino)uracil reductase RibD [Sandaracinaceae bacterium]|nr:bifunctional diaminohydroxyphosphoribosylaminopyrimidine deaminase/5-amino-6-(5-phosphoribosylamino)uracil reductase RibD [Sandaracinaceae bacterium]